MVGNESAQRDVEKAVHDLYSTFTLFRSAGQERSVEEDMKKSGLNDAVPWLDGVAKRLAKSLLKLLEEVSQKFEIAAQKVQGLKMPSLENEADYRKEGLQNVGMLAQLSAALEGDMKKMKALREGLSKLKSTNFSMQGDSQCLEELRAFEARLQKDPFSPTKSEIAGEKLISEAAFHVAAVAASCLVRSDAMKKADAKMVKQLADIAATLRTKWEALPEDLADLKKFGGLLLDECENLGKAPVKGVKNKASEPAKAESSGGKGSENKPAKKHMPAKAQESKEGLATEAEPDVNLLGDEVPAEDHKKQKEDKKDKTDKSDKQDKKEKKEKKDKKEKRKRRKRRIRKRRKKRRNQMRKKQRRRRTQRPRRKRKEKLST